MQAAERIFEGQFDDVRDVQMDCVADDRIDVKGTTRLVTPDGEGDGYDGIDEDEDVDDYVDYDSDYETKADPDRIATNVDPYSGIFFSKERREEVIEVEEDPEVVVIPGVDERVKLMTQGQWMKGCPEGGEQSFLFGLYSLLSQGECLCPHACGASISRRKSHFFAIYSDFSIYIEQLQKIVRRTCQRCHLGFCFACGEPVTGEKVQRPAAATDDDPLFHCSNLQGVILGIGLSMLEQMFSEQSQEPSDVPDHKVRNSKRRKMDVTTN
jgi:hypothetical protein